MPIDFFNPRDPANKYLYHSSIESDEMMDIYKGNVTTPMEVAMQP